jgi:hypothetical protein
VTAAAGSRYDKSKLLLLLPLLFTVQYVITVIQYARARSASMTRIFCQTYRYPYPLKKRRIRHENTLVPIF